MTVINFEIKIFDISKNMRRNQTVKRIIPTQIDKYKDLKLVIQGEIFPEILAKPPLQPWP